ncbi:MAG: lytic transglycosylase domain-containing protein [Candidatus Competibacteraceae bacterium]|nr:lytic transglycosylase domain-containing protein [Candidatus Competibacteraceae bacterium]
MLRLKPYPWYPILAGLVLLLGAGSADAQLPGFEPPHPINETNRSRYSSAIERAARRQRLDPALVHAVISAESGYNPRAVSSKGAMGLMQLMPATARLYGVDDPFDPVANIEAGTRYLRRMVDRFKNLSLALAAYNAGPGAVARYRNTIPPYLETRRYVVRVTNFYIHYRQAARRR